ncbi:hypothetical protein OMAG_000117, partial [Candidatus Omnitrophus magneticus]
MALSVAIAMSIVSWPWVVTPAKVAPWSEDVMIRPVAPAITVFGLEALSVATARK